MPRSSSSSRKTVRRRLPNTTGGGGDCAPTASTFPCAEHCRAQYSKDKACQRSLWNGRIQYSAGCGRVMSFFLFGRLNPARQVVPSRTSKRKRKGTTREKGVNFFCNLQISLFFFGTPNARTARWKILRLPVARREGFSTKRNLTCRHHFLVLLAVVACLIAPPPVGYCLDPTRLSGRLYSSSFSHSHEPQSTSQGHPRRRVGRKAFQAGGFRCPDCVGRRGRPSRTLPRIFLRRGRGRLGDQKGAAGQGIFGANRKGRLVFRVGRGQRRG